LFDRFIGQFVRCPGIDGTAKLRRWRTGQVNDLDNLLSRKAARGARSWSICQHGCDYSVQIARIVLHGGELGFSRRPATAPLAHGGQATAERLGESLVALSSGGAYHDPSAESEGLRAT
jgi:hypothetical protein